MGRTAQMEVALVLNPRSGAGRAGAVAALLREHGAEPSAVPLESLGPLDAPHPERVELGTAERVVVAGGDGSVGLAAALAEAHALPLAVVPTGTANDFARAVGVPLDVREACALAVRTDAPLRPVELARIGRRPFVNAASVGLSPLAAERAGPLKRRLGRLAYPVGAAHVALRAPAVPSRVRCDGREVFTGSAWQVTVAATGAFGGGAATGGTHPTDGLLDVAVVEAGPRRALLRRAAGMRAGRLVDQDEVLHIRGDEIELDVPPGTLFNVDGELCHPADRRMTAVPDAFRVVAGR